MTSDAPKWPLRPAAVDRRVTASGGRGLTTCGLQLLALFVCRTFTPGWSLLLFVHDGTCADARPVLTSHHSLVSSCVLMTNCTLHLTSFLV